MELCLGGAEIPAIGFASLLELTPASDDGGGARVRVKTGVRMRTRMRARTRSSSQGQPGIAPPAARHRLRHRHRFRVSRQSSRQFRQWSRRQPSADSRGRAGTSRCAPQAPVGQRRKMRRQLPSRHARGRRHQQQLPPPNSTDFHRGCRLTASSDRAFPVLQNRGTSAGKG